MPVQAVLLGRKTINRSKQQAFFYIALATLGMILLGVGLQDLNFQAGSAIPGSEAVSAAGLPQPVQTDSRNLPVYFPWLMQCALALGILVLLVSIVTLLLKKSALKRIGLLAVGLVVLFVIFSQLPQIPSNHAAPVLENAKEGGSPLFEYATAPIGEPPAGLFQIVIAGLLLTVLGLGIWLLSKAFRSDQKLDPLTQEADAAVQAITEGENLKNVIVRSYLKMERVIAEQQGIEREEAVTPREFESYLINKGIPRLPILQLTRLFEKARYGVQVLNEQDEQTAIDCLMAIRDSYQTGKKSGE